jgi:dolichol-phosphate mannosyltransferase
MKPVVMIPTFNEADNIETLIEAILALSRTIEILVVDDDSPDGTAAIVEALAQREPRVHLLLRTHDRGRGKAGIAGFLKALQLGADCVIEMDADFSHHPRYIPAFLEAITRWDVVVGSRALRGGEERGRTLLRRIITKAANFYIRALFQIKVRDCTSGFRCFRRKVLETIALEKMVSLGPSIVEEVLYACHRRGFTITEIPIVFEDRMRGKSTLDLAKLFNTFVMILRFRFPPAGK